jgi:hypothetical protein
MAVVNFSCLLPPCGSPYYGKVRAVTLLRSPVPVWKEEIRIGKLNGAM